VLWQMGQTPGQVMMLGVSFACDVARPRYPGIGAAEAKVEGNERTQREPEALR
jgi:hypothetical protein